MKKSDLKSGQLIKTRNDEWFIVIGDQISNNAGMVPLDSFDEDLCNINNTAFDIVEVYKPRMGNYLFGLIRATEGKKIDNKLLWKRTPIINWNNVKQNEPIKIVETNGVYIVRHFYDVLPSGRIRVVPDGRTTYTSHDNPVFAEDLVNDFSHFELEK